MASLSRFSVGGTVTDDGRIMPDDRREFRSLSAQMAIGLRVTITVEEDKEPRSKTWEQVKYWWAVPIPLVAEHCGMSDRQAHVALLGECFGYVVGFGGHVVPAEPSMADLPIEKMTHLITWVLDWAPATLEVIVPPPDKNWKQHAESIRRQRGRAA